MVGRKVGRRTSVRRNSIGVISTRSGRKRGAVQLYNDETSVGRTPADRCLVVTDAK
jgi:hypothetical protein